jgi:O-antigen chain-terminating methyltransferase
MVDVCRSQQLEVEQGDALSYLERQPDASVGALTAIQVVEHFEPAYLVRFLEAAFHKMTPGAPLMLETINAACWMAFFETYIRDLTHQRPLHPDTLRYLVEASGFSSVDVRFRQPVSDGDRLKTIEPGFLSGGVGGMVDLAAALNDHAHKLNARLFSSMDYAVIARR